MKDVFSMYVLHAKCSGAHTCIVHAEIFFLHLVWKHIAHLLCETSMENTAKSTEQVKQANTLFFLL